MAERPNAVLDRPYPPDSRLWALGPNRPNQKEILSQFSPAEQQTINYRRHILDSLASFVGKDFKIPVDLNSPGEGWYWDFQANRIGIDPQNLLEDPFDESRFKVAHEGSHRRISRMEVIPLEVWREPGFSFLMNAIEDPRVNNFVVEAYRTLEGPMRQTYQAGVDFEAQAKTAAKEKLGQIPRFTRAGFEYIKQWFRWSQGQGFELSEDLPEDVRQVVQATLEAAEDSWRRYPAKAGADRLESENGLTGEDLIKEHQRRSYEINRDRIWPEFKKLVDKDIEDQMMQQSMQGTQQGEGEGQGAGIPQPLSDRLTPAEQQALQQAIEDAINRAQSGQPQPESGQPQAGVIDFDSLSPELQQKIKDYIDSLPENVKRKLAEMAKQAMEDYEKEINTELEGKLSDNPDKKAQRDTEKQSGEDKPAEDASSVGIDREAYEEQQRQFRDIVEEARKKDQNLYEDTRTEVLPIIDELENDLRELFVARKANKWHGGHRSGKRVDIKRRIQEKAKGVSVVESRAWQRRELPQEKDYAITMLVDLSGSMQQGGKILETFKAAIVLAEVLNRLSIKTEILGFNDRIYEYQSFGQPMSREIRDRMGGMLKEVTDTSDTGRAQWNDDGWALKQASERLARQRDATEKFLFVLSDGRPEESPMHPRGQYELSKMVTEVMGETDQKLIGLGVGNGTAHVEHYYPNSVANIGVKEMAQQLAGIIREAISNSDQF